MHADAGQLPARSAAVAARPRRGFRFDGRTQEARRAKQLAHDFTAALGGQVSALQELQIKRLVEVTVETELLRASAMRREPIDRLELVRLENLVERIKSTLGLPAKPAAEPDPWALSLLDVSPGRDGGHVAPGPNERATEPLCGPGAPTGGGWGTP
jgi:hypothetical protein